MPPQEHVWAGTRRRRPYYSRILRRKSAKKSDIVKDCTIKFSGTMRMHYGRLQLVAADHPGPCFCRLPRAGAAGVGLGHASPAIRRAGAEGMESGQLRRSRHASRRVASGSDDEKSPTDAWHSQHRGCCHAGVRSADDLCRDARDGPMLRWGKIPTSYVHIHWRRIHRRRNMSW